MQDPVTGEFMPQPPEYLETVPGPDLLKAFRKAVTCFSSSPTLFDKAGRACS